ncbi:hypothetical protein BDV95DRAFT_578782 [Massariosphaeria phaeospora]|uniref:EthD domain-containing protein n=1 Tax=Massariosphaeria phaeospora TaxID=100035 RepID=A0A7C8I1T1_9PLEO|nr:hypothetical protein BDV95DRAFT_578782 [Massariosphaeria phaeospora]
MTFIAVAFETRQPSLSIADFTDYYDNVHVPIIKAATGSAFPQSHTRYYLKRKSSDPTHPDHALPLAFLGDAQDFDYDAIVFLTFASEAHFNEFQAKYGDPEVAAKIGASADKFILQTKLRVVGVQSPHTTTA